MADVTKKEVKRERIFVPYGGTKEEDHVLVIVNGKAVQIPKGKASEVPAEFAAEYQRSLRAAAKYTQARIARSYQAPDGKDPLGK